MLFFINPYKPIITLIKLGLPWGSIVPSQDFLSKKQVTVTHFQTPDELKKQLHRRFVFGLRFRV